MAKNDVMGQPTEQKTDIIYMSKKGYEEAKKRLHYLQTVKRDEIVARIAEARSHGDLSENAEYDAARNEQAANEGEIVELEYKIKNAGTAALYRIQRKERTEADDVGILAQDLLQFRIQ